MANKKAAEPTAKKTAINFKCSDELKRDLEELAHMSRRDVSSILVEVATELVKANKREIANSRRRKPYQVKLPTFAAPKSEVTAEPPNVANTGTTERSESA